MLQSLEEIILCVCRSSFEDRDVAIVDEGPRAEPENGGAQG